MVETSKPTRFESAEPETAELKNNYFMNPRLMIKQNGIVATNIA